MTDVICKAAAVFALATLLSAPASAQEVRVFSDGRAMSVIDPAANELRGRPRDERKARKPLSARSDAAQIAAAHADAFLHCGFKEAQYPAGKEAAPQEASYFVKEATWLPIPHTKKIILLGEYARGKAIVDTDKLRILTPQCPAGVRTMFWSFNVDRIVVATQEVSRIDFHGGSRAMWTAKFKDAQDLWFYDSKHDVAGFRKLASLPDEKVLDVLVPDMGDFVWVLSHSNRVDLGNPRKMLRAVTGTPSETMDITLRKLDLHGAVMETVEIARAVQAGSAQFVRE